MEWEEETRKLVWSEEYLKGNEKVAVSHVNVAVSNVNQDLRQALGR